MGNIVINGKLVEDPVNFQKIDDDLIDLRIKESRETFQQMKAEDYQRMHTPIVRTERKIGRNDPCPCGSGRKFKKCHGG